MHKIVLHKASQMLAAGVAACLLSTAAGAAGVAPPNYPFGLTGAGNLIKNGGSSSWACSWSFKMLSGASTGGSPARAAGGTMSGGTATGTNCSVMTIAPTTWSITSGTASSGAGVFHGLNFLQSGTSYCQATGDVPFTITNSSTGAASFTFNYAPVGQCTFTSVMNSVASVAVVP